MNNLFVGRFLPGNEICRRVDAVVCHGGHGTMFESFRSGKPVLAIPFNPDQMAQATRIQELGLGHCLLKLNIRDFLQVFTFDWQSFNNLNTRIKTGDIVAKLDGMMENKGKYASALEKFNADYPPGDGAKQASDIILA
jgi:UDP-N-acetylglucosamine:LPS N-acetylglucosamine transferase